MADTTNKAVKSGNLNFSRKSKLTALFLFDPELDGDLLKGNPILRGEHENRLKEVFTRFEQDNKFTSLHIIGTLPEAAFKLLLPSSSKHDSYTEVSYENIPHKFSELENPGSRKSTRNQPLDYLVAFWDGVDDGAVGSIGHLVRRWLEIGQQKRSEKKGRYYQALVPAIDNDFPIARYFSSKNDFKSSFEKKNKLICDDEDQLRRDTIGDNINAIWSKYKGWISLGLLLFIIIGQVFYFNQFDDTGWIAIGSSVIVFILCILVWWMFKPGRALLLRFVFPIILAISTLVLGTYGFKQYSEAALSASTPENPTDSLSLSDSFLPLRTLSL